MRDPSFRRLGACDVLMKGFAMKMDCNALRDTFSQFRVILLCKIADEKEHSLGDGFVHFEKSATTKTAIDEVSGMSLEGERVHVVEFMGRRERKAAGLLSTKYTIVYV